MALNCTTCGTTLEDGAARCPTCGAPAVSARVDLGKEKPPPAPGGVVSLGKDEAPAPSVDLFKASAGDVGEQARPVDLGKTARPADGPAPWAPLPADSPDEATVTRRPDHAPEAARTRRGLLVGALAVALVLGVGAVIVLTHDSSPSGSPSASSTADGSGDPAAGPAGSSTGSVDESGAEPSDAASDAGQESSEGASPAVDEAAAHEELQQRVAADAGRASELQGVWTAQIASSSPSENDSAFLARYDTLRDRYGDDVLLVWSGDWPGSFGPSSASSWVLLDAAITAQVTQPILDWCASEGWGKGACWAKRLASTGDDPAVNTDHFPADQRNN
jgi:hypothetical protein